MRKISVLRGTTMAVVSSIILLLAGTTASAAGGGFLVAVSPASASSTVGNTLTFVAEGYYQYCPAKGWYTPCDDGTFVRNHETAGKRMYITVSGSGNTLGGVQTEGSDSFVIVGTDGMAQFTLKSSVAETKTITVKDNVKDTAATATATFTSPVTQPTPQPRTTTQAATPTPTPTPTPPAAPTNEVTFNNKAVTTTTPTVQSNKAINLSGVTVPNGVVTLYIFSTPRTATVTADATGKWTYEIVDLEPGSHHVEAEVTDPATKLTSARATLASFKIAAAPVAAKTVTTPPAKKASLWPWIAGGVLFILAVAGGMFIWVRRRHHQGMANKPSTPPAATDDHTDQSPPLPPA